MYYDPYEIYEGYAEPELIAQGPMHIRRGPGGMGPGGMGPGGMEQGGFDLR